MSDWEISADTQAHLVTVIRAISANLNLSKPSRDGTAGFTIEGFLNNGTRFCINYYRNKPIFTGNNLTDGLGGRPPEFTIAAGVYAIMRWFHPNNVNPPNPSQGSGVTLIPLPADSPVRFA